MALRADGGTGEVARFLKKVFKAEGARVRLFLGTQRIGLLFYRWIS
jgi:hypothetical protein